MATINGITYTIGDIKKGSTPYLHGFRYIAYSKDKNGYILDEHGNLKDYKVFRNKTEVNAFIKANPQYAEPSGLYEKLKPIQKLLWKDDDLIEWDAIITISNKLNALANDKKYGKRIAELAEMFCDDCMEQEVLFDAQDRMANLVLDVAYDEKKDNKLTKDFPWLYHTK